MLYVCITAIVSSMLWLPLYPLFSYCTIPCFLIVPSLVFSYCTIPCFFILPPCVDLKWYLNVVIIFLTYLSMHTSTVKYPRYNNWFNKWLTSRQCFLPPCLLLGYYCMRLLAFEAPFSDYSAKRLVLCPCKTNRIVAGLLWLIQTITHTWSVRSSSRSILFMPKTFSYCMAVLE